MTALCTRHCRVKRNDACILCSPPPRTFAVNIVCISATQPRKCGPDSAWDGLDGRPFIGEVVSEYLVAERHAIERRADALERQHVPDDLEVIYL